MAKKQDIVVKEEGAVAIPDFLKGKTGYTGAEDIETQDITVPRIKVGQALSAEVKDSDSDVQEGDLYLNVTGEVLAKAGEPLPFIPVARSKEYILWRDRNYEGGGIMARAQRGTTGNGDVVYYWDKPNTDFENKIRGISKVTWTTEEEYLVPDQGLDAWGSEIPGDGDSGKAATAHHNYVVALPTFGNMICAFSLSKTQAKRARDLNAMIRLSNLPMYARIFHATTDTEQKGDDSWANVRFKAAGTLQSEDDFLMFEGMHQSYRSDGFTVDQSGEETSTKAEEGF